MNIFATSPYDTVAARDLDDVRLRKMILETAQLVATALRERFQLDTQYKSTHKNHPCNVWARESTGNLQWLIDYGLLLHYESITRFGKTHKSGEVLGDQASLFAAFCSVHENTKEDMTPFANCARRTDLDLDFTHLPVHDAYRAYLNARWALDKKRPKWTNTHPPAWANYVWHGDTHESRPS